MNVKNRIASLLRFFWLLAAVTCLAGIIFYRKSFGVSTQKDTFFVLALGVLFWDFLILWIGGKKGLPFAVGISSLAVLSLGFLWLVNQISQENGHLKELFACSGVPERLGEDGLSFVRFLIAALGLIGTVFFPILFGRLTHRIIIRPPKKKEVPVQKALPATRKIPRGWRGLR